MSRPAPAQLSGAAVRRAAWSSLRQRFDENLTRFERRTGCGEQVAAAWRDSAARLQLLRFGDGDVQVFSQLADRPGWLPAGGGCLDTRPPWSGPVDVTGLRARWNGKVIRTLAVSGLGLGYAPLAVVEASRGTFLEFSPRVLLIESSWLAWAVALHLHDWQATLDDPRVVVCAGPDALQQFEAHLDDADRLVPVVIKGGEGWPGHPAEAEISTRVAAAATARSQRQARLYARLSVAPSPRDRTAWAGRYAEALFPGGRPLNILGITSRYTTVLQYTMRDLLAAFAAAGHATHLCIEPDNHAHFSPLRAMETIDRVQPDLIVLIDHTQREFAGILPDNIPVATWIQDQLPNLFNGDAGAGVRPLEFVFGHGFPECLTRFGYPPERFLPCGIPTNPVTLLDPSETDDDRAPFSCDLMFATNATSTPAQLLERFRNEGPHAARPLIDSAYEELLALLQTDWFCGDYHYAALLERCERASGREITDAGFRAATVNCLRGIADQWLRERVARWAAEWADKTGGRLHLYGRGWDTRPEFARFARGFVPHGALLGRAFRAAKVSLHAGVNPALHQRVIDGLCAGGCFLIAEKPFDTSDAVSRAILTYYQRTRPVTPLRMTPELLPEPAASAYRRGMWLRGVDPAVGDENAADDILNLRLHCEHRLMHTASSIWPRYGEVVFHGHEQFIERLEVLVRDDARRQDLAGEMRTAVLDRFTYDALARRLLHFMRDGLAGRTASLLTAPDAPSTKARE